MFGKILIANRGEIAIRVARTCRELGVATVGVHSDVDAGALHAQAMDEVVHLPGVAPNETYLNVDAVIAAGLQAGAEAVHPGYGFLSENADFAEAVERSGMTWVGPPPEATRAVGDKIRARNLAQHAGVPVVPGVFDAIEDPEVIVAFGREHGYPLAVKAAGGGGGRGLKVARSEGEAKAAFDAARREAEAYFGSRDVYVERYLEAPKHLEVQILAPEPSKALWLGVRDCSLQRRHQKLIEETPPPLFTDRMGDMGEAAVALAEACGYVNAGTVEMLVDEGGQFYFLEVNARLQVEHTVTEEIYGVDLVACQLKIASGDPLGFDQKDLVPQGHAIECRVNAEDPARGFIPTPGRIQELFRPEGHGIRIDAGYGTGDEIPSAYDSLIAKVIVSGYDREEARKRMLATLQEMRVEGVQTTIPAHLLLLEDADFIAGIHTTRTVEDGGALEELSAAVAAAHSDVLLVDGQPVRLWSPAMAPSATAAVHGSSAAGGLVAPMQGTILRVAVEEGQEVEAGATLIVLEAMKMETVIASPAAGIVKELRVAVGDTASAGQVLAVVE
ncbi:MAG TPA: biotin carboxylase N-terminal domain-containing protein [Actinomycetota bacterium]|nr:biotin carboxylase N-terminal domain-containing protein [Actinomycetota bacterium]